MLFSLPRNKTSYPSSGGLCRRTPGVRALLYVIYCSGAEPLVQTYAPMHLLLPCLITPLAGVTLLSSWQVMCWSTNFDRQLCTPQPLPFNALASHDLSLAYTLLSTLYMMLPMLIYLILSRNLERHGAQLTVLWHEFPSCEL